MTADVSVGRWRKPLIRKNRTRLGWPVGDDVSVTFEGFDSTLCYTGLTEVYRLSSLIDVLSRNRSIRDNE